MGEAVSPAVPDLLRRLTIPVAAAVGLIVSIAWYVTWASSNLTMMLMAPFAVGATDLALFFALIVVMMVAMMLPSALPMALAYYGITRLEDGRPTKPADVVGTIAFLFPYFVVWGFFGLAALLGLMAFGLVGSTLMGPALFLSAGILLAAASGRSRGRRKSAFRSARRRWSSCSVTGAAAVLGRCGWAFATPCTASAAAGCSCSSCSSPGR